MVKKYEHIFDD